MRGVNFFLTNNNDSLESVLGVLVLRVVLVLGVWGARDAFPNWEGPSLAAHHQTVECPWCVYSLLQSPSFKK